MNLNISQQVGKEILCEANNFYESVGYTGGVKNTDVVFIARKDDKIIGLARLCKEEGIFVLRGLYVAEDVRGGGIGTRLLQIVSDNVGNQDCWCVPYKHLYEFYSNVGFSDCRGSEVPAFLLKRCHDYILKGMDVIIMKRPGSFN